MKVSPEATQKHLETLEETSEPHRIRHLIAAHQRLATSTKDNSRRNDYANPSRQSSPVYQAYYLVPERTPLVNQPSCIGLSSILLSFFLFAVSLLLSLSRIETFFVARLPPLPAHDARDAVVWTLGYWLLKPPTHCHREPLLFLMALMATSCPLNRPLAHDGHSRFSGRLDGFTTC